MYSLLPYNSFKIEAYSDDLIKINSVEQLIYLVKNRNFVGNKYLILGGGSNILFTKNFDGVVLKNELTGIAIFKEDDTHIWIKSSSGENWSKLVDFCVENNWGGIENLSLIPGTAGAAPIQNIGAYGVELKDRLTNLEAIDMSNGKLIYFTNEKCQFGYRESIFKNKAKDKYFITNITLKLDKNPVFNTTYGEINKALSEQNIIKPTIINVSNVIKKIRMNKLPNPEITGNAGSFFKNPIIDKSQFDVLIQNNPDLKYFNETNGKIKIAAGWLIENAGLKGKIMGNAAVHNKQALVLINNGNAKGEEIKKLAYNIIDVIYEKYDIMLTPEVNIL